MQHTNESLELSALCRCASYSLLLGEGISSELDVFSNEGVNYRVLQ